MTCHRRHTGRRGEWLLIFNLDARRGWVANITYRPLYPLETALVPRIQWVRWAPRTGLSKFEEKISHLHQISKPIQTNPWKFATPTMLSRPRF